MTTEHNDMIEFIGTAEKMQYKIKRRKGGWLLENSRFVVFIYMEAQLFKSAVILHSEPETPTNISSLPELWNVLGLVEA